MHKALSGSPVPRPWYALFVCLLFIGLTLGSTGAVADTEVQQIDRILKSYHAKGQFDGVALVARQDKILYRQAFGLANREWNIANRTDTKFRVASILKQFTALLIMQYVEQGKLKLDGHISDYLPDYRKDTGNKITLKDLLTHTSGLPNLDDVPGYYQNDELDLTKIDAVVKSYCSGDLKTEPGKTFVYNNADYILLGAILEKVSGKTYEQLLNENILQPLQMKNSGFARQETVLSQPASGYQFEKSNYTKEPYFRIQNFYASGAMYSTVDDLLKWDRALDKYTLLSKPYTEVMFTPLSNQGYVALGSWVYKLKFPLDRRLLLIERQGSIGAFHLLNIRAPEQALSLILLSNLDTSDLYTTYSGAGLPYEILKTLSQFESNF